MFKKDKDFFVRSIIKETCIQKKGRTLVIGDIHGALKALKQVLKRCKYSPKTDKLIFLGDYVDGYSQSAEVIEYLINLYKENKNIIFIEGNHDKWCKDWLINGEQNPSWKINGGDTTVASYIRTGYLVKDSHRKFFKSLHNYYIDDSNRGFVHGGYISRKGLGHEPYIATYYWDRDLWGLALTAHTSKDDFNGIKNYLRFNKHKEVYIGHTATINWKCKPHYIEYNDINQVAKNGPITIPMNRYNVWNIDTGCGWDGKLTALNIDTKEYWQSDFTKELYPDELGR